MSDGYIGLLSTKATSFSFHCPYGTMVNFKIPQHRSAGSEFVLYSFLCSCFSFVPSSNWLLLVEAPWMAAISFSTLLLFLFRFQRMLYDVFEYEVLSDCSFQCGFLNCEPVLCRKRGVSSSEYSIWFCVVSNGLFLAFNTTAAIQRCLEYVVSKRWCPSLTRLSASSGIDR